MTIKSNFGAYAEALAEKFLLDRGYEIKDRNFRKPWGEIDIIARKDKVWVFVEVKASSVFLAGFEPEARANREKLLKVIRTAKTYLSQKGIGLDDAWQVDIISISFNKLTKTANIKHFKNVIGE